MSDSVRLVLLSDTHGLHDEITVPPGDILVHAGDVTPSGSLPQLQDFNEWLATLPHPKKLVIAGNHDWCFQQAPDEARAMLTNATYLEDEKIEVAGIRFYGSPWQPWFMDWAFNLPRGEALAEKWAAIPADTDVLITHGPPMGILDETMRGAHVGCEALADAVRRVAPKLHVFGHIHEGFGTHDSDLTRFVNASVCDVRMVVENSPVVLGWPL